MKAAAARAVAAARQRVQSKKKSKPRVVEIKSHGGGKPHQAYDMKLHAGNSSIARAMSRADFGIGISSGTRPDSLRVRGRELIASVTMPTPAAGSESAGLVVVSQPNVCTPTGTRLLQFAGLYQRWHPRQYTYRWTPALPTTTPGTFVFAQDPDPLTVWNVVGSAQSGNPGRLMAASGSRVFQSWEAVDIPLPSTADYTSLWTIDTSTTVTEGDRLCVAGQLIGCVLAPTGVAAGSALGTLELLYDIEFYTAKLSLGTSETHSSTFQLDATAVGNVLTKIRAAGGAPIVGTVINELKRAYDVGASSVTARYSPRAEVGEKILRMFSNPTNSVSYGPDGVVNAAFGGGGVPYGSYTFTVWVYWTGASEPSVPFMTDTHQAISSAAALDPYVSVDAQLKYSGSLQSTCNPYVFISAISAYKPCQTYDVRFTVPPGKGNQWVDLVNQIGASDFSTVWNTSNTGIVITMSTACPGTYVLPTGLASAEPVTGIDFNRATACLSRFRRLRGETKAEEKVDQATSAPSASQPPSLVAGAGASVAPADRREPYVVVAPSPRGRPDGQAARPYLGATLGAAGPTW